MQSNGYRNSHELSVPFAFEDGALIVVIGGTPVVVAPDRLPEADAPLHLFVEPIEDQYRIYAVDEATLLDVFGADWRVDPTLLADIARWMHPLLTLDGQTRLFSAAELCALRGYLQARFHGGAWVRLKECIPWVGWMRSPA
jgi:hypothetical protein